jgi:hypothetical protein
MCLLTSCDIELSDDNDLWAHIEAYASTFTACLPTLRPLTHGLTSVIGSVRSLLSRSKTILDASGRNYERQGANMLDQGSVEHRKIGWYELHSEKQMQRCMPCHVAAMLRQ